MDHSILSPNSRVWIYQSERELSETEVEKINERLASFALGWASHGQSLTTWAGIEHNLFLVFMVDETKYKASGCSIDSSVHLVRELGSEFQIDFFNRMNVAYKTGDGIKLVSASQFEKLYSKGEVRLQTPVYNNLVKTKAEFDSSWLVPVEKSWHARMLPVS